MHIQEFQSLRLLDIKVSRRDGSHDATNNCSVATPVATDCSFLHLLLLEPLILGTLQRNYKDRTFSSPGSYNRIARSSRAMTKLAELSQGDIEIPVL